MGPRAGMGPLENRYVCIAALAWPTMPTSDDEYVRGICGVIIVRDKPHCPERKQCSRTLSTIHAT